MCGNEEIVSNVAEKISNLVEELAHCRKRALEIELQLSTIDEALKKVREPRPIGRPRGRPRKTPIVPQIYDSPEVVADEDFGGNTAT